MNTKVKKEEGEGLLPVLDQRFSCSSWKRPQQSVSQQPLEKSRCPHCRPGESTQEQQDIPQRNSSLWTAHAGAGSPSRSSRQWEGPSLEQGKGVRRKEQQRSALDRLSHPSPTSLQSSVPGGEGQVRKEGVKLRLGKGVEARKEGGLAFVSRYPTLF